MRARQIIVSYTAAALALAASGALRAQDQPSQPGRGEEGQGAGLARDPEVKLPKVAEADCPTACA